MPSSNRDDHDLREVLPGMHCDGVPLADFSPTANEPDLDVWPLGHDKGRSTFSGNPEDLVPIYNTVPEPHVRWLTHEQFEYEFGYNPADPADAVSDEVLADIDDQRRLTLSETRMEAFQRIAKLWNGEPVGPAGVHLIADKVPSWDDVFGDLDERQLEVLRPTVHEHDEELVDAFGEFGWFEPQHTTAGWVKSTYIARSRADYAPEERTRTLINGRDDIDSLRGDPYEGLKHRFGVGVEAARATFCEHREVETYVPIGDYTVDLLEHDSARGEIVGEVLTHHHNTQLYRETWEKLVDLQRPAVLVFDSLATARRVLNHWHDWGVDVPGGRFETKINAEWARSQFREAAADPSRVWPIEDVLTLTMAWDLAFDAGRASRARRITSLDW